MSFLLIALWVAVLLVNLFFWSTILLQLKGCLPDIRTTFVPQEFILVCTL